MNVVLISHDYPPINFGGIGSFSYEIAQGLARKGNNVHVITGIPKKSFLTGSHPVTETDENGVNVVRIPYPNIQPRHTFFQICNQDRILKIINKMDVDVFHGQCGCTYPLIKKIKDKAPTVITFHGSPMMEKIMSTQSILRGGSLGDITSYLIGYPTWKITYQKELQYSNAAVAVSASLRRELLQEMGEKYSEKLSCIHNGINIDSLTKKYGTSSGDEDPKTILFAGRLFWRKGALAIISLAYLLQKKQTDFHIIVHGEGPLLPKLKALKKSLNLRNISIKGFTTKAELLASMKKSKFIAIPSYYEACPMILLECMCLGKIPLMFKLPYSYELSENGKYGLLADNLEELCQELISTVRNSDLHQMSSEIQTFSRANFDVAKVVDNYMKLYNRVIKMSNTGEKF